MPALENYVICKIMKNHMQFLEVERMEPKEEVPAVRVKNYKEIF